MFAYHIRAHDKVSSKDGLIDEKLNSSARHSVYKRIVKVEPFLQLRNIDFISPLDSFLKQKKVINNPTISLEALEKALGMINVIIRD